MPTSDSGDDLVGVLGPDEGSRVLIGFLDEAVDGGLKVGDGVEDPVFEASSSELGEVSLHSVEPGARCRGEMEGPSGMSQQPLLDLQAGTKNGSRRGSIKTWLTGSKSRARVTSPA